MYTKSPRNPREKRGKTGQRRGSQRDGAARAAATTRGMQLPERDGILVAGIKAVYRRINMPNPTYYLFSHFGLRLGRS